MMSERSKASAAQQKLERKYEAMNPFDLAFEACRELLIEEIGTELPEDVDVPIRAIVNLCCAESKDRAGHARHIAEAIPIAHNSPDAA